MSASGVRMLLCLFVTTAFGADVVEPSCERQHPRDAQKGDSGMGLLQVGALRDASIVKADPVDPFLNVDYPKDDQNPLDDFSRAQKAPANASQAPANDTAEAKPADAQEGDDNDDDNDDNNDDDNDDDNAGDAEAQAELQVGGPHIVAKEGAEDGIALLQIGASREPFLNEDYPKDANNPLDDFTRAQQGHASNATHGDTASEAKAGDSAAQNKSEASAPASALQRVHGHSRHHGSHKHHKHGASLLQEQRMMHGGTVREGAEPFLANDFVRDDNNDLDDFTRKRKLNTAAPKTDAAGADSTAPPPSAAAAATTPPPTPAAK